ncbi:MAG: S1C family serine protease [Alphaproteobacteria bacterium]
MLRSAMRHIVLALWALAPCVCAAVGAAQAQSKGDEILRSVVGIIAEVPEDARTAATLGPLRRGSGVVIDSSGLIVTVGYLIMEASRVIAIGADGAPVPAKIVAYDWDTGFGLLRTATPMNLKPIELGSAAHLKEGHRVLIASRVNTEEITPATVASRRDFAGYWEYLLPNGIFTTPMHSLFGGAALLGPDGKLLGIGSLALPNAVDGDEPEPGNMFIPVDALKEAMADLLTNGYRRERDRPWLGIYTQAFGDALIVVYVAPDSPAQKAGLRPGDRIAGIAGKDISDQADFYKKLWAQGPPGTAITLNVERRGGRADIAVATISRQEWLRPFVDK